MFRAFPSIRHQHARFLFAHLKWQTIDVSSESHLSQQLESFFTSAPLSSSLEMCGKHIFIQYTLHLKYILGEMSTKLKIHFIRNIYFVSDSFVSFDGFSLWYWKHNHLFKDNPNSPIHLRTFYKINSEKYRFKQNHISKNCLKTLHSLSFSHTNHRDKEITKILEYDSSLIDNEKVKVNYECSFWNIYLNSV